MKKYFYHIIVVLLALLNAYQLAGPKLRQRVYDYVSYYVPSTAKIYTDIFVPSITVPPTADWTIGFEPRNTSKLGLPYQEYTGFLEQSANDRRKFRVIRLPNNLTVICAQDYDSAESAAALSVGVGSLANPPKFQGLAHFLEHMLFQGSEMYPSENEYNAYLSSHSGDANAYTTDTQTVYHFSLANKGLEGALSRFSRFFIDPLFNADSVDREVMAVDSEHKGNLQKDGRRWYQLLKSLSNPDHAFSLFPTGDVDTLKGEADRQGVALRDELLKFHSKYYSADVMKLAISGNHTLDQLTEWAVSMFTEVQSKGDTTYTSETKPITKAELGRIVYYETVMDIRQLALIFPMPDLEHTYRSGALAYIETLLNRQDAGSLYDHLKNKNWVTHLDAGSFLHLGQSGTIFGIEIDLTRQGLENYDEVIRTCFGYLQKLDQDGPQEWYFEELRTLQALNYRYYKRSDAEGWVISATNVLNNPFVQPGHVVSNGHMLDKFSADEISQLMGFLNPSNYLVTLGSKTQAAVEYDKEEKHYGTRYHVEKLPGSLLRQNFASYSKPFAMPWPNIFLESDLETDKWANMTPAAVAAKPTLLRKNNRTEVWFKKDDQFFEPRGLINTIIDFQSNSGPLVEGMLKLIELYAREVLDKELQNTRLAGLRFAVNMGVGHISVKVSGYSKKLPLVPKEVLQRIKSLKINQKTLDRLRKQYLEHLSNMDQTPPQRSAFINLFYIHSQNAWTADQIRADLDRVTVADLQSLVDHMFDKTFTTIFVAGDFEEDTALMLAKSIDKMLGSEPLPDYLKLKSRSHKIDTGYYVYQEEAKNNENNNSAVVCSIYCGNSIDVHERLTRKLLKFVLEEPTFDQLRTKEQLGYSVGITDEVYGKGNALQFYIQGESSPAYMTMRIDSFIRWCRQYLIDYSPELLANKVSSVVDIWEEKPKSIVDEAGEHWYPIESGLYGFNQMEEMIEYIKKLTKQDLVEFWDKYINPETATAYTRIDSQMWSTKVPMPTEDQFEAHSTGVTALHSCLYQAGLTNITIEQVGMVIAFKDTVADVLSTIAILAQEAAYANADEILENISDETSKANVAIRMALEEKNSAQSFVSDNGHVDLSTIGMRRSPKGIWLITHIGSFRDTQALYGFRTPYYTPTPKYKD
ncbi:metalloprotease [Coemansia sp. Benny D115]|nr:metalloprotease [Coemansia sp. Benny D115]